MRRGQKAHGLEQTLASYIAMHKGLSYRFGYNDCLTFCMRWALGELPALYHYHDKPTGIECINRHGGDWTDAIPDYYFKQTDTPKLGDICKTADWSWGHYGIFNGEAVIGVANNGKIYADTNIIKVWSVND